MSQVPSEPEMTKLESALRALSPAPSRLDRDRLMFEAGALARGRTGRARWLWPSVAAALAITATAESMLLVSRPEPRVVERLVVVPEPAKPPAHEPEPTAAIRTAAPALLHREDWGDPSQAILPSRWETVADARHWQDRTLALGLDGLADPGRVAGSSGPTNGLPPRAASVGDLRRTELENLLNPGDRS
jgi:hypothetical protein